MIYNKDTIIYVLCPQFYKTGGTELAHQFVYEANKLNINAIITYIPDNKNTQYINPEFEKYVSRFTTIDKVKDSSNNIIIFPETEVDKIDDFKNIRKCIWWMSVDNYLKNYEIKYHLKYFGVLRTIKWILLGKLKNKNNIFKDTTLTHFYQSQYAHNFLTERGIKNTMKLSDYINDAYITENSKLDNRQDIVLYNPKKGYDFTKKLIKAGSKINWQPIENMKNEEVHELLKKSKVYIDFGNHPGKDRFPREAVMSGCCIITGKNGSANFFEDVMIPDEFKFDNKNKNINKIINKINYCLENYNIEIKKFSKYKNKIKNEHEDFILDIKKIFERED